MSLLSSLRRESSSAASASGGGSTRGSCDWIQRLSTSGGAVLTGGITSKLLTLSVNKMGWSVV